ncbi:MAG: hypothetical protein HQM08_17415 [Candidatus Riflebacteria bacterium]|nr:hypothetical protein [Candidatus Riflebacteria bacterium]
MGVRKTGKYGQIMIPTGDGIQVANAALTKSASKTIQGTVFSNRFYATASRSMWNKGKGISARIQGIVGEASVTPATGNNNVQTNAFSYYKDNGTIQSAPADTSVTIVRPATGKYNWNLVVVDMDDGTISAITGSDGDSYSDVFDAAGGPPLVAIDKLIIGAVKLSTDTAAPVVAADITQFLSTGTLIQERSDMPGYFEYPMEGGVLLNEALLVCHTGSVARKVYASYYDFYSLLTPLGDTTKWSLDVSSDTTSMQAQGDSGAQSDLSGPPKWSGGFSRFHVRDVVLYNLGVNRRTGIVRLFPDRNDTTVYYEGAVIVKGFKMDCDMSNPMMEEITFEGDGNLELRGL